MSALEAARPGVVLPVLGTRGYLSVLGFLICKVEPVRTPLTCPQD